MSKPHANDDEIILLAEIKRKRAKEALSEIAQALGRTPHRIPSIGLLLDYLSNMVFAIELLLKLLSSNWKTHNVGEMYETAFGKKHTNQLLMDSLKSAIMDQKYLYEPASGLKDSIPEIEGLYEGLHYEVGRRFPKYQVLKGVELPKSFGEFLRDHLTSYFKMKSPTFVVRDISQLDFGIGQQMLQQYMQTAQSLKTGIDNYLTLTNKIEFEDAKFRLTDTAAFVESAYVTSRTCDCGEQQVTDDGQHWYCPKCATKPHMT